jgi:hypothetical protein
MGRAGFEPALLHQELGPKPSAYASFATCPCLFLRMEEDMNNVLLYCKPLSFKEKRLVLGMRAISVIIYTIFQVFLSIGKLL